jgi:hypothetical protein
MTTSQCLLQLVARALAQQIRRQQGQKKTV